MTIPWETVHIFISSTFNDMHAERDYLVKQVFPELREWCERRKLRLVDIDLRWGVTEQDATSQNVVKVCLDRIDECRPFFLCFLGQRRGWVPKEDEISTATKAEFPAIKEYAGKASVTELEILHALVNPLHRGKVRDPNKQGEFYEPSKYAFFYLRENTYLDQLPHEPPQLRQTYTNEGVENEGERLQQDRQLKHWRDVEIPSTKRPVRNYQAHWDPRLSTPELLLPLQCPSREAKNIKRWQDAWQKAGVTVTGVDVEANPSQAEKAHAFNRLLNTGRLTDFQTDNRPLGQVIVADLQEAIAARYPEHTEAIGETDLQKELDQQEQFLSSASEGFIERGGDFDELDTYIKGDSNQLFVLTAPGGMGKSSLLAKWVNGYHSKIQEFKDQTIHYRFIGQSDRSTTVYSLLNLLLREIKEVAGKIPEEIPDEPQKLRQTWIRLISATGQEKKVVIVLDALNQLDTGISDLAWLPFRLPKNIKLIVSIKSEGSKTKELLQSMEGQIILSEVKPFINQEDRREVVRAYLDLYLKQLDEPLMEALIQSPGASNPLYLKVVLSELRVFGAFPNLGQKIYSDFGETPISAFNAVLARAENDSTYTTLEPKKVVPLLFGLLAHARHGLSIEELVKLLILALRLSEDAQTNQAVVDTVHLYLRQVRSFLAQRGGRYYYFFENFQISSQLRYTGELGSQKLKEEWHQLLANYFKALPTWLEQTKQKPNLRKTSELVYHQAMGRMWAEVYTTLTDFHFLEARCRAQSVFDLATDYDLTLSAWQGEPELKKVLEIFEECIRLESHAISKAPELLFPQVYNQLSWVDKEEKGPIHSICEQARLSQNNWLCKTQYPQSKQFSIESSMCGHSGPVWSVAISSDGTKVLSGSSDSTLKLWDLSSGQVLLTMQGHKDQVTSVFLSQDRKKAISAALDGTIKVWDINGRLIRSLDEPESGAIALTPDGHMIVTGGKGIKLWSVSNGQQVQNYEGHTQDVIALAITPNGKMIISGSKDGTLKIWDLTSGELITDIHWHTGYVNSLVVTPNGRWIISGSSDGTLKVWDLISSDLLLSMKGHSGSVKSIAITPDGLRVVSVARELILWDLQTAQLLQKLDHPGLGLALTANGKQVIFGRMSGTLELLDLAGGQTIRTLEGKKDESSFFALGDDTGVGLFFEEATSTVQPLQLPYGHPGPVGALAVTPDGKQLIAGSWDYVEPIDRSLKVWDVASGRLVRELEGHLDIVWDVGVTPDGKYVVSGSADNTVKVWELSTGELRHTLVGHTGEVTRVIVTPDGQLIISGSSDKTVKLWDLATGNLQYSIVAHSGEVKSITTTSDGKRIISGSSDGILKIWDIATGRLLSVLNEQSEHSILVNVQATPDGRQIIAGSWDMTISTWDMSSFRLLHTFIIPGNSLNSLTITNDGKHVLLATMRILVLWDIIGNTFQTILSHDAEIISLCVTPDSRYIVIGDKSGSVWVYEWVDRNTTPLQYFNKMTTNGYIEKEGIMYTDKQALIRDLTNKDKGIRGAAVQALSNFKDDETVTQISEIFKDLEVETCGLEPYDSVYGALLKIHTPLAVEKIVQSCKTARITKGEYIVVLGMADKHEGHILAPLIAGLDDENPQIKDLMNEMLRLFYSCYRYSINQLIDLGFKDKDDDTCRHAENALRLLGYS